MSLGTVVALCGLFFLQVITNIIACLALLSAWGALREVREVREEQLRLWALVNVGPAHGSSLIRNTVQGGSMGVQGGAAGAYRSSAVAGDVEGDIGAL